MEVVHMKRRDLCNVGTFLHKLFIFRRMSMNFNTNQLINTVFKFCKAVPGGVTVTMSNTKKYLNVSYLQLKYNWCIC